MSVTVFDGANAQDDSAYLHLCHASGGEAYVMNVPKDTDQNKFFKMHRTDCAYINSDAFVARKTKKIVSACQDDLISWLSDNGLSPQDVRYCGCCSR